MTELTKYSGWPDPSELSKDELVCIIMELQGILWAGKGGKVDADKEWSADEIEKIAELLAREGLAP